MAARAMRQQDRKGKARMGKAERAGASKIHLQQKARVRQSKVRHATGKQGRCSKARHTRGSEGNAAAKTGKARRSLARQSRGRARVSAQTTNL